MADLRTTITEVVTGLGMLGFDDVETALLAAPDALLNVERSDYEGLLRAWKERQHPDVFTAALMNGGAFLSARDGLRGRKPVVVEWKGAHRAPGDEVVPADLRIDHVYLVSCKYLSRIVVNASPHHLFDRLLAGGHGRRGPAWFGEVAPTEHETLYAAVRSGSTTGTWTTKKVTTGAGQMDVAINQRTGETYLSWLNRPRTEVFSTQVL